MLSVGDELILHDHGVLALCSSLLGRLIQRCSAGGERKIAHANLLLDLASLGLGISAAIRVDIHSLKTG